MKKGLIIAGSILGLFVILIGSGVFYLTRGLDSGKNLEIGSVNVSLLEDGVYHGSYSGGRWTNELSVTVKDKKITRITIEKDVTFKQEDIIKQLISAVIEKQNTTIDTISGATVTSKAYLKSIENAINKKEGE